MADNAASRRTFLRAAGGAGVAWLFADALEVREALAWAAQRRHDPPPLRLESLSPVQGAVLEAVTARIIPSDDGSPGAREAGVIHFIDRALATFAADQKPMIDQGGEDLNRRAAELGVGASSFDMLSPEHQDAILRAVEETPFFQSVRFLTLAGMFAEPSWGGNREHAGWDLIGQEHQPLYVPPFGWYDAEASRGR